MTNASDVILGGQLYSGPEKQTELEGAQQRIRYLRDQLNLALAHEALICKRMAEMERIKPK